MTDNNPIMPGIPPAPTESQFEQIAKAIDPNARVISTRKMAGGISCRMDVLELATGPGAPTPAKTTKVIVRQYYEEELRQETSQNRLESTTLRILEANNVPAPGVIVGEEIGKILGRPAIVISYLDGVPGLTPDNPHDWARQLARAIAQVHAVEVPEHLAAVLAPVPEQIQRWLAPSAPPERFSKHELGPRLWEAMQQLWPNVDISARNLNHGDFWPGNTVWKDGNLLAIVDWEGPQLGEPTLDIGYFLSDAAYFGIDIEEIFLAEYEKSSGRPTRDLQFWKMAAAARAMPDVGPWAQGYVELGIRKMTADEIRRTYSNFVKSLLV